MQQDTADELARLANILRYTGNLVLSDRLQKYAVSWNLEIAELKGRIRGLEDVIDIQSQVIGPW